MNSLKIGTATSIVAYASSGTTPNACLISPCLDTSSNNSKNITMHRHRQFLDSRWKKWDIHNPRRMFTVITRLPSVSLIKPSNDNNHDPWRWDSFGLRMQWNRESLTYNTTLEKKTSQTTRVSTTQVLTIKQSDLGISTNLIQHVNSQELESLAL